MNTDNNDNINNAQNNNPTLSPTDNTDNAKLADKSAGNKLPAPDEVADFNVRAGGGHLELLEERPVVSKERLDVGKVTVTKHSRTKTIEVPIELVEEYVTITTDYQDADNQNLLTGNYDDKDVLRHVEPTLSDKAVITINGNQVEIGDAPVEIVVSRQVATVTKDTFVIQEVAINKTTHTHTDSIQVELKHEELDVQEEGFLARANTQDDNR